MTLFVLKLNLSDNRDVTTGSSRPALSHGTKRKSPCIHSPNETKVIHSVGNSVPINVPQSPINAPLVGKEPLKESKVETEKACSPPTSPTAGSEASTINGDVTATCVHQNVGALDGSAETKVEFHDFNIEKQFANPRESIYMKNKTPTPRRHLVFPFLVSIYSLLVN